MVKILVCGLGRHGKDSVCEWLAQHRYMTFASSSRVACEYVVFPALAESHGYATPEECFRDRHNHRREWFDLIRDYNTPDKSRLAKLVLDENDIYCGMRCKDELAASRHLFDFTVWVDATQRLGRTEGTSSCTITSDMCDFVLYNNGTLKGLYETLERTWHRYRKPEHKALKRVYEEDTGRMYARRNAICTETIYEMYH